MFIGEIKIGLPIYWSKFTNFDLKIHKLSAYASSMLAAFWVEALSFDLKWSKHPACVTATESCVNFRSKFVNFDQCGEKPSSLRAQCSQLTVGSSLMPNKTNNGINNPRLTEQLHSLEIASSLTAITCFIISYS